MSRDCSVALPRGTMGLSAVCDCGISYSYSLIIFDLGLHEPNGWAIQLYRLYESLHFLPVLSKTSEGGLMFDTLRYP